MKALWNRKRPGWVIVDISQFALKIFELGKTEQGYRVQKEAIEPIAGPIDLDTHVDDLSLVSEAIQRAIKKAGITTQLAAIALPESCVFTKTVQMSAALTSEEKHLQILSEADRYFPFPIERLYLDFQELGSFARNPDFVHVLLVASRAEYVQTRIDALRLAGLTLKRVDIVSSALEKALEGLCEEERIPRQPPTTLIKTEGLDISFQFNLLPWREEKKAKALAQFYLQMGFVAAMALVLSLVIHVMMDHKIEKQKIIQHNVSEKSAHLDKQMATMDLLNQEKRALLSRIKHMQPWQKNCAATVQLLNHLARIVPEGISFTALSRTEDSIVIEGKACENAQIAALMRTLASSDFLLDPVLHYIQIDEHTESKGELAFAMMARQKGTV